MDASTGLFASDRIGTIAPMCVPEGMLEAIDEEMLEVQRRLGGLARVRLVLTNGRLVEAIPGAFGYVFTCEVVEEREAGDDGTGSPYQIAEDTSGVVSAEGRYVPALVLAHDPVASEVSLELQLYAPLASAERVEMTFSTLFLLTGLQSRLKECQANALPLVAAALEGRGHPLDGVVGDVPRDGLAADQADAIRFALGRSVSYVWGPPGTGKTRTLGHLVKHLLAANETVLLSASTNVAVDRLVESALDALGSPERPPIVRLGRIGPSLRGRGVSAEDQATRDGGFGDQAAGFERAVRGLGIPTPDRWTFDTLLRVAGWVTTAQDVLTGTVSAGTLLGLIELAKAVLDGVGARTLEVPIVATTLCGSYTRAPVRERSFDTVIVDEASMASVAHFVAATSLAKMRIVVAGDFQQLPPIVLSRSPNARRYLGQHVFSFAGCDDVERDHPLRRMLTEQWRMHPEIGRTVSRVFYGDRLRNAPGLERRPGSKAEASGALLVDTHGCKPQTNRTRARSIRNPIHAKLIAEWLAGSGWKSVGVIAPYRAQARAIRRALRERCRARLERGEIQVSTVHKFQGEERDLIVFDTTDAPGDAGHFLNDARNPAAANLVNVAISRAKHALVVVGDVQHVRRHLGEGSAVHRVMLELMHVRDELNALNPEDTGRLRTFLLEVESLEAPNNG